MKTVFTAAAAALMLFGSAAVASAKETVSFGYLLDPSHEAVLYALKNELVTSDKIDVEAKALSIPALIQATSGRTFDVVQTAAMAIPRARSKGLDMEIVGTALRYHESGEGAGIWVPQDSPLKTAKDLKGKKLAVYSLGSAGITLVRIALENAHGLDVSLRDGDLEFVELPAPAMPAALATNRVDAATLIHAQAYEAMQSGQFRSIAQTAQDNTDAFGVRMVSAVLASYPEVLEEKPEAIREFLRLLKESAAYAQEHPDEVFAAVGKETDVDPDFFATWFERFSDFPVSISDDDVKAIDILWKESKELGILEEHPEAADVVWSGSLRE